MPNLVHFILPDMGKLKKHTQQQQHRQQKLASIAGERKRNFNWHREGLPQRLPK